MKQDETLMHLSLIMETYNNLPQLYPRALHHYYICIKESADDVIAILNRLLSKDEIRTCRIPLLIDFNKVTKLDYWLNCKIFNDLSKSDSTALREKLTQMTNLLRELQVKRKQVDSEHAEKFFRRMMGRVKKNEHRLDYEIWRADRKHHTLDQLSVKQIQLTFDVLINGVLDFDADPINQELGKVRLDLVEPALESNTVIPKGFEEAAAKIRRYTYWAEELFMINYPLIFNELYQNCFEKLTPKQRWKLFDYDLQLNMLHEDMVAIKPELAKYLYGANNAGSLEDTIFFAPYLGIKMLLQQKWFKTLRSDEKYDAKWADKFAEELMRSEYGKQIAEEWKEKSIQIKGYIIGCLKNAGVINPKLSNDAVAREAGVMDNWRSFGRYIGKESQKQPYAEWILNHVNDYC